MNKRSFLKTLGAAITGAVLPAPSFAETKTAVALDGGSSIFFTGPVWFDYGNSVGIAITLPDFPGGQRRHAVRMDYIREKNYTPQHEQFMKRRLIDWAKAQYA